MQPAQACARDAFEIVIAFLACVAVPAGVRGLIRRHSLRALKNLSMLGKPGGLSILFQVVVSVQVVMLSCGGFVVCLLVLVNEPRVEQGDLSVVRLQKYWVLQVRSHVHWCLISLNCLFLLRLSWCFLLLLRLGVLRHINLGILRCFLLFNRFRLGCFGRLLRWFRSGLRRFGGLGLLGFYSFHLLFYNWCYKDWEVRLIIGTSVVLYVIMAFFTPLKSVEIFVTGPMLAD